MSKDDRFFHSRYGIDRRGGKARIYSRGSGLHSLATKLAVPEDKKQTPDFIKLESINSKLQEALDKKDSHQAIEVDEQFHHVFLKVARNIEIDKALERIVPKIQRLTLMKFESVDNATSINQHEEIIIACRSGDMVKAAHLVEENWLTLGRLLSNVGN